MNTNITSKDLGEIYNILDKAVVSGDDVTIVYNLKMKIIMILKAMQGATPKPETIPETPKTEEVPASTDALDMK